MTRFGAGLLALIWVGGAAFAQGISADDAATPKSLAARLPSSPRAHDLFRWPLRGRILKNGDDGLDINAPVGESVHAAAEGTVTYAGEELASYGKLILIRHANDYVSAYAYNSELLVAVGADVKRGQIIAKSGKTGAATSPRLHFELRKNGKPVDPTKYLAPM